MELDIQRLGLVNSKSSVGNLRDEWRRTLDDSGGQLAIQTRSVESLIIRYHMMLVSHHDGELIDILNLSLQYKRDRCDEKSCL